MAVDRYRRWAVFTFATAAVLLGLKLRLVQVSTCLALMRISRVILLEPGASSFAATLILVVLGNHFKLTCIANFGQVRVAGQSAPLVLSAMSGEMAADVLHSQPAH